jgi:N-acetylated-alpha-linked acidic dipeptidase
MDGVIYINVDIGCTGPNFWAKAMPSLREFLPSITQEVTDPNSGKSFYSAWKQQISKTNTAPGKREKHDSKNEHTEISLTQTRVGSGSDHTAFLNFICMPVIDMGFSGPYGVYHSQFDNFFWMSHFGDPQFHYHATMAKIWGIAALRLANADILPFDYTVYAQEITKYVKEIESLSPKSLDSHVKSLLDKLDLFHRSSRSLNNKIELILSSGNPLSHPESLELINTALMKVERCFGYQEGIPQRPWFKHLIYAPRFTYAPEVLPGVTEALEDKDWERAQKQLQLLENAVMKANRILSKAIE